jgi:hypothetical protein
MIVQDPDADLPEIEGEPIEEDDFEITEDLSGLDQSDFEVDIYIEPTKSFPASSPGVEGQRMQTRIPPIRGRLMTQQMFLETHSRNHGAKKEEGQLGSETPEPNPGITSAPDASAQPPITRAMTQQMFQSAIARSMTQTMFRSGKMEALPGARLATCEIHLGPDPSQPQMKKPELSQRSRDEFEKGVWAELSGVILKNGKTGRAIREIGGGHLLAKVLVSDDMKKTACETKKSENGIRQGSKGNPQKPNRAGTYLVLKSPENDLFVLGGRHADKVDAQTLAMVFDSINSDVEFLQFSQEIEMAVEIEETIRRKFKSKPIK